MSILKDSSSYQLILQEGRDKGAIEELHETLLNLGAKQFGTPDQATMASIQAIADLARLKRMRERLLDVGSWQELLATP